MFYFLLLKPKLLKRWKFAWGNSSEKLEIRPRLGLLQTRVREMHPSHVIIGASHQNPQHMVDREQEVLFVSQLLLLDFAFLNSMCCYSWKMFETVFFFQAEKSAHVPSGFFFFFSCIFLIYGVGIVFSAPRFFLISIFILFICLFERHWIILGFWRIWHAGAVKPFFFFQTNS